MRSFKGAGKRAASRLQSSQSGNQGGIARRIDGREFSIVYTLRQSVIRIISARKGNRRQCKEYENGSGQG